MFKRLITFLYRKWCEPPHIKTLYLGGVQRNFERALSEKEITERNLVVYTFLQTGWFEQMLLEELHEYVKILFDKCDTEKQRNFVHDSINVLLKFEERIKRVGSEPEESVAFDKHNL